MESKQTTRIMSETEKEKHQHDFIEVNQQPKPEEKQARKQVRQTNPSQDGTISTIWLRDV